MKPDNATDEKLLRDLRVSEVPLLEGEALSELIEDWVTAIDDLIAKKMVKKAMLTAASLVQIVRDKTLATPAIPKLILLVVRLSGLYGNKRLQREYLDLYFSSTGSRSPNSDQEKLLEYTLLFVVNDLETDNKPTNVSESRFKRLIAVAPRLNESNKERVKDLYSGKLLHRSKLQVIDAFLELISDQNSNTQQLLLKSCLYGYLCMNPLESRESTMHEVFRTLRRIREMATWNTELDYLLDEEVAYFSKIASSPAQDVVIDNRQHSLATKPRTLLNFIALNSFTGQVNRCLELLHRLVITPLEKETIPELCSYVEGEITTVISLGLAKNKSSLQFGTKDHASLSALSQLRPAIKAVTRGDFDFAKQFLSLHDSQLAVPNHKIDHLQHMTKAILFAIDPFSEYVSTAATTPKNTTIFSGDTEFPKQASLIDHLVVPGIKSLIETSNLLNFPDNASDERLQEAYSQAIEELRSVHRAYGSRNFLFLSISILILRFEIDYRPNRGVERIDSIFNLFRLVDFDNPSVTSKMHIDMMEVARKGGNHTIVAKHATILANLALEENDARSYAISLTRQLETLSASKKDERMSEKLITGSISWLSQYVDELDSRIALELKVAIVRELVNAKNWDLAEMQLETLIRDLEEDLPLSAKRVIYNYVALVASKLGKFSTEAEAWRILKSLDSSNNAYFYTLQETRARILSESSSE